MWVFKKRLNLSKMLLLSCSTYESFILDTDRKKQLFNFSLIVLRNLLLPWEYKIFHHLNINQIFLKFK